MDDGWRAVRRNSVKLLLKSRNKPKPLLPSVNRFMSNSSELPFYTLDEPTYKHPYYSIRTDYTEKYRDTETTIVIDNGILTPCFMLYDVLELRFFSLTVLLIKGSYKCRAGWAVESSPARTISHTFQLQCLD